MKTFLRVLLCVVVTVVAFKLLPVLMVPVVLGGLAAAAGVGLILLLVLLAVALAVVAVLAPIWIPVLAIVGLVALIRRANRKTVKASV